MKRVNGDDTPEVIVLVSDGSEDLEFVTIVDVLRRAKIKTMVVSIKDDTSPIKCAHGLQIIPDAYLVMNPDSTHLSYVKCMDSIATKKLNETMKASFSIQTTNDNRSILLTDAISVILPGGGEGAEKMSLCPKVLSLVSYVINVGNGFLGAICAAPLVIKKALDAKKPTLIRVHTPGTVSEETGAFDRGDSSSEMTTLQSQKSHQLTVTSYPCFEDKLSESFNYSTESVVVDGRVITSRGPGTAILFALKLVEVLRGNTVCSKVARDALFNLN